MTVTHIYSHNKEEKERRAMEFCPALLGPQFLWRVSLSCSLRHLWPLTAAPPLLTSTWDCPGGWSVTVLQEGTRGFPPSSLCQKSLFQSWNQEQWTSLNSSNAGLSMLSSHFRVLAVLCSGEVPKWEKKLRNCLSFGSTEIEMIDIRTFPLLNEKLSQQSAPQEEASSE